MKQFKRLAACFLIAFLLVGTFSATSAQAALKKPGSCRFTRWNNKNFTACRISWDKVSGADYYEIRWTYPDGSNYNHRYQYGKYNVLDIEGLSNTRIYKVQVRALDTNKKGKVKAYSSWSDEAFITPLPHKLKEELRSSGKVKLSWNKVHSSRGYRVYMTTNPAGKWHLVKTTEKKSGATSVKVSKYQGSKLKKKVNYYVRIVTRFKYDGEYQDVFVPSGYYQGGFRLYTIRK